MLFDEKTQKELERLLVVRDLLDVYVMRTLLLSQKLTEKHLRNEESFGHLCIMEMSTLYWREGQVLPRCILALERCLAITDWENTCCMNGLGGSDPDSLYLEWHFSKANSKAEQISALYKEGKSYKDWFENNERNCFHA